jgi:hypothetical protein
MRFIHKSLKGYEFESVEHKINSETIHMYKIYRTNDPLIIFDTLPFNPQHMIPIGPEKSPEDWL